MFVRGAARTASHGAARRQQPRGCQGQVRIESQSKGGAVITERVKHSHAIRKLTNPERRRKRMWNEHAGLESAAH